MIKKIFEWINTNLTLSDKLDDHDIPNILAFSLLWNMFESIYCSKNANMDRINKLIDSNVDLFKEKDYEEIFEYFKSRYTDSNYLNKLRLQKSDKILAQSVINSKYRDKNNKLKFIMSVIYRYRNNLFHGEKQLVKMKYQEENFKYANKFLMYFIETCKHEVCNKKV